jgi:hypothetical protein
MVNKNTMTTSNPGAVTAILLEASAGPSMISRSRSDCWIPAEDTSTMIPTVTLIYHYLRDKDRAPIAVMMNPASGSWSTWSTW